jgi:hypothetical protein
MTADCVLFVYQEVSIRTTTSGCLTIHENEFPVDFQEEFQDITTALRPSVNDKLKKQVMIGSSLRLP